MSDTEPNLINEALNFIESLKSVDLKPRTVAHKIDGRVYTSTKFPTMIGLELGPRAGALFGAAFAKDWATGETSGWSASTLVRVSEKAAQVGLWDFAVALLSAVKCNALQGIEGNAGALTAEAINEHFAGEYLHLLKVCSFVFSHNFRGPTLGGR